MLWAPPLDAVRLRRMGAMGSGVAAYVDQAPPTGLMAPVAQPALRFFHQPPAGQWPIACRPCSACRSAKVKCNREMPCSRCRRLGFICKPPPTVPRGRPSHHSRLLQLRAHENAAAAREAAAAAHETASILTAAAALPEGVPAGGGGEAAARPPPLACGGGISTGSSPSGWPTVWCSSTAGRSKKNHSCHESVAVSYLRSWPAWIMRVAMELARSWATERTKRSSHPRPKRLLRLSRNLVV